MFVPANVAHFTLLIPFVRNDFKVLVFEGIEAISTLYSTEVELVSEYPDVEPGEFAQPIHRRDLADGERYSTLGKLVLSRMAKGV
ncbi:hypothetical protein ACIPLA_08865 [Pseudomonas sp. NPDC086112]|jgi:uncharacterized protein involved in type VI secretion and phage assembly|uniref:hypothetical protein n=1 Tax=Pseudomonas sp. NPDC086112 TaxID=3364430 RepID=UPI003820257C